MKPAPPVSQFVYFILGTKQILKGDPEQCGSRERTMERERGSQRRRVDGREEGVRDEFTSLRYGEWVSEKMQKRRQRGREKKISSK